MTDQYERTIEYLRISLTDRCNLRCRYCMPERGVQLLSHADILRYDEIERLVRIMAALGVRRIRLTGGEPLVRHDVSHLAAALKEIAGIDFLGVTTNGILLPQQGSALCGAGVDGVNISLDTLDRERFAALTRRDNFDAAFAGLQTALRLPFRSVKVNCVLSPQSLERDWLRVVALAKELPVDVRLIEWMPMADEKQGVAIRAPKALAILQKQFGKMRPLPKEAGCGPASYYELAGFKGRVGIIPAMSSCFCAACNRVRLTATGDLKLCLFYDEGVPLRQLLRGGVGDDEIARTIVEAVRQKPQRHTGHRRRSEEQGKTAAGLIDRPCGMFGIGG